MTAPLSAWASAQSTADASKAATAIRAARAERCRRSVLVRNTDAAALARPALLGTIQRKRAPLYDASMARRWRISSAEVCRPLSSVKVYRRLKLVSFRRVTISTHVTNLYRTTQGVVAARGLTSKTEAAPEGAADRLENGSKPPELPLHAETGGECHVAVLQVAGVKPTALFGEGHAGIDVEVPVEGVIDQEGPLVEIA